MSSSWKLVCFGLVAACGTAISSSSSTPTIPAAEVDKGERICKDGSVMECRAACEAHNATACFELAEIVFRGDRVPADNARGAELLLQACNDGLLSACDSIVYRTCGFWPTGAMGESLRDRLSASNTSSECTKAVPVFHQSCALGAERCWNLAAIADAPRGEKRFAYDRICHSGDPKDACGRLKDLALAVVAP